jgi:tetratricopeptide (TPR) repeat protein
MKSKWSRALLVPATTALCVLLSSNAFADQYKGPDLIRCDFPDSPFQMDFTTMTSVSSHGDHVKLHWNGAILEIVSEEALIPTTAAGNVAYRLSIDVTTGGLDVGLANSVEKAKPGSSGSCRDDKGLIPNAHFKPPDPAQAQAENQPPLPAAKAISAKLSAAQKTKAQTSFKQAFELFQGGEFDAAIAGFKEGLAIDPGSGLANYYLGECYARQQQDDLARIRYQRAVDLAPGTKEALLAKARLAK